MSTSTHTQEWFAAPVLNENNEIEYITLDREILQLPVLVTLDEAVELVNLSDNDAKSGAWNHTNYWGITKEIYQSAANNNTNLENTPEFKSHLIQLRLTSEGVLALKCFGSPKFISAAILTGCVINKHINCAVISIYYYILMKKHNNRVEKVTRYRYCMEKPENVKALNNFFKCIQFIIRGKDLTGVENMELVNWKPEKVLVVLNPVSGKKESRKIFDEVVVKMLNQACMDYKLVITSYTGHAHMLASRERLDIYASILFIGGDGLYNEFLNGIMDRIDRKQACEIPLAIIPAGSNNTLAGSILKSRGEHTKLKYAAVNSMFAFIKGTPKPFDVVEIRSKNVIYFSALYYTWGNIAEIFDQSRRFAFLGSYQFVPWMLVKILRNRGTYGRVWYRHANSDTNSELIELQSTCFSVFLICNVSNISYNTTVYPNVNPGSGYAVLCFIRYPIPRKRLWKLLKEARTTGTHVRSHEFECIPIQALVFEPRRGHEGKALSDGEILPQSKMELVVMPSMCTLIS